MPGRPSTASQQCCGRFAPRHRICHSVSLLLVCVPGTAHAARELHARALLDHVRGLVRDRVQVGLITKGDVIARGIGFGAHLLAGRCGFAANVGADLAQVIGSAERCLDAVEIGKATAGSAHASGGGAMHGSVIIGFDVSTSLDGLRARFRQCREPTMRCIHP